MTTPFTVQFPRENGKKVEIPYFPSFVDESENYPRYLEGAHLVVEKTLHGTLQRYEEYLDSFREQVQVLLYIDILSRLSDSRDPHNTPFTSRDLAYLAIMESYRERFENASDDFLSSSCVFGDGREILEDILERCDTEKAKDNIRKAIISADSISRIYSRLADASRDIAGVWEGFQQYQCLSHFR